MLKYCRSCWAFEYKLNISCEIIALVLYTYIHTYTFCNSLVFHQKAMAFSVSLPLCNVRKKNMIFYGLLSQLLLVAFLSQVSAGVAGHCTPDQFMCTNGQCIVKTKLCDGHLDCSDNTDEMDCDLKMCRKPDWFQCAVSFNGPCLSSDLVCNGIENCPGGEDEWACATKGSNSSEDIGIGGWHYFHRNCTIYEFMCKLDRACVPLNFVCDGHQDCRDGSDETAGCANAETNCTGFLCKNKHCLESKAALCDGFNDCGDGSDEMNCDDNCTPEMGKFLCKNNITCIPLEKACDGKAHCPDGSDESPHCTAGINCQNVTCPTASKCQMMPRAGAQCICPKGFRHSLVGNACVDINECYEQYGACSQNCTNVPGTYRCSCDEGYTLREDNRTCVANGEEALLLYTTQVSVMGVNLRSRRVYTVATNLTKVIGVAYDGEHIYWTNMQQEGESIAKANRDGSRQEILLSSGLDAPEDLEVDWLTGNIYFSDKVMQHIAVCSNNGYICVVLVTDDVHHPRGVALWPQRSQIFWTDWGENPMIARASMDGANSKRLITENILWPNGIALDMYNDRMYWLDAKMGTMESARTDGTDRRVIFEEILKHPYGLAIFEDKLYWSDWGTRSIHSCNKFSGKDHKVITKDRTTYAVHIYHSAKQKKTPHACERLVCSHLCLLAENNSFSCACPEGMQLSADRFNCVKTNKTQRLFLGALDNLMEMEHTTFGRHIIAKTHKLNMMIHEIAYNSVNDSVFVADNFQNTIKEVDLLSNTVRTLVKRNLGNVTALAFDHLSYNLYWTDSERSVVELLSLQTRKRAVVSFFSGLEAPIGLAVVPDDGIMFVALKSRQNVHVDQISLSGFGEHSHVFEDELGDDHIKFATDYESHTLYWSDSDLDRILYADYHKLEAYTFRPRLKTPYDIAIVNEDIFWSDHKSNKIHWTHYMNMGPVKSFDIEVNNGATVNLPDRICLAGSTPLRTDYHPCQNFNGGCSHICVTLGKLAARCLCPVGLVFEDDRNQTCVDAVQCKFRCPSGECLTKEQICNNRKDCPDNSDEKDCDLKDNRKPKVICPVGKFMCHNAEQCVEGAERCDGQKQCRDGSDEDHCENFDKSKLCHLHQYVCDNGHCVDYSVMCDEFDDCGDNSDEKNCDMSKGKDDSSRPVCGEDMFQCNSGTCIAKSWECDGKIDCSDVSDEHEKCDTRECPSDMYKCRSGQCIDRSLVCDGRDHCGDMSDEDNCDTSTCTDQNGPMYECPNNLSICLDVSAKCNGTEECPDGEDEADCGNVCQIYEFQCKTGRECIRNEFRCDKSPDCADGSDEENCARHGPWNGSVIIQTNETPCGPKMWSCRDGECVDQSRVCNDVEDCDTGADEGPLCKTACRPVNGKPPCEGKCKATPTGAVCSCFSGYTLDADHRSCLDINECEEQEPCAQLCENTVGSFKCSCYPDFMMRLDKTSCKSIESERSILLSAYDEVRRITEQPAMMKVAWTANDSRINSFDLNVRTRKAYFTIPFEDSLYQIDVDTAEVEAVLQVPNPEDVAVDWVTGNVYVTSLSPIRHVRVCSFSAKMCGSIFRAKLSEIIKSLIVDAYNRRLFYAVIVIPSVHNHLSRIVSASLDGTIRRTLVTKELSFISALACDPYKKTLYYTDIHDKTLQAISYGSGSKGTPSTLKQAGNIVIYPIALSWYENQLFIVNMGSSEAMRCYLYGKRKCKPYNLYAVNTETLLIDGSSRQPINSNPCNMTKCGGMCVQSESAYKCMCGDAFVNEGQRCDASKDIVSSLLDNQSTSAEDPSISSHTRSASVVWSLIVVGLLLLCGLGYIYCRKRHRPFNFVLSTSIRNKLASLCRRRRRQQQTNRPETSDRDILGTRTGTSSDTPVASYEAEREKMRVGSSIQGLLHGPTSSHGSDILLETKKPHGVVAYKAALAEFDSSLTEENFDCDLKAQLVP